jgi:hypothetical protein
MPTVDYRQFINRDLPIRERACEGGGRLPGAERAGRNNAAPDRRRGVEA